MHTQLNKAQWKLKGKILRRAKSIIIQPIGRDATSPLSSKMSRIDPSWSTKGLSLSHLAQAATLKKFKAFRETLRQIGSHACPQQADCKARLLYARVGKRSRR